jgi:hypothetical protein
LRTASRLEEEFRADVRVPVEFDFRAGAALNVHERHEVGNCVAVQFISLVSLSSHRFDQKEKIFSFPFSIPA